MRAFNSVFAFSKLGGDASAAAPELSRFVREVRYRDRRCAAWALGYIGGSEALAALLAAVRDERTPAIQRASIGGAIPHLNYRGPELTNAVPVMIACLRETNQFVPSIAASALGAFLIQPEQCVPALAEAIDSPNFRLQLNALRALGDFGPNAATAIKAISKALDDPERVVREEATNALQKIAPEVLTNGVKDF
jgi:HEAT repeat protein